MMKGVPNVGNSIVDVRDVALAHVRAAVAPAAVVVGHRYLLCAGWLWYADYARFLAREFEPQGYSIKQMSAPYAVLWLAANIWDAQAGFILPLVGTSCSPLLCSTLSSALLCAFAVC
jgi:hypothetical protein